MSRATRILFLKVFILTRKATKGDFIATIEATLTNNRCASWRRKKKGKECTRKNGRIWKLFKNHNSGGGDYKHWQIIMALFHLSPTFAGLRIIRKGCVFLTTKKVERESSELIVFPNWVPENVFFFRHFTRITRTAFRDNPNSILALNVSFEFLISIEPTWTDFFFRLPRPLLENPTI